MPEIAHGTDVLFAFHAENKATKTPFFAFHAENKATKTPFGWGTGVLVALTALLAFELVIMWVGIGKDVYNIAGVDDARGCILMNATHFWATNPSWTTGMLVSELAVLATIVVTSLTLMWVLLDHMRACPPTDVLALVAYEIIVIGAVLMNIIAVAAGAIDSVNLGFAVSEALIVGPFPFLVTYSSQLPLMQAPAGSERHLLLTRSFCAAVLGVSATYWLRFRLNGLICNVAESGAADSGGGKLALVCYTVAYFSRTYTAIKLVGWCAAKIRRPLSNVLSNTPQPLPARQTTYDADQGKPTIVN